jgi:hypothetical protein
MLIGISMGGVAGQDHSLRASASLRETLCRPGLLESGYEAAYDFSQSRRETAEKTKRLGWNLREAGL